MCLTVKHHFWDNDRVGDSNTADGSSWERINCGNGISGWELSLGHGTGFDDAGPAVDPSTGVIMQCPPGTLRKFRILVF